MVIARNLSIYLRLLDIQLLNLEQCSGWQQVDFDPNNVSNNAFFVKTIFIKSVYRTLRIKTQIKVWMRSVKLGLDFKNYLDSQNFQGCPDHDSLNYRIGGCQDCRDMIKMLKLLLFHVIYYSRKGGTPLQKLGKYFVWMAYI